MLTQSRQDLRDLSLGLFDLELIRIFRLLGIAFDAFQFDLCLALDGWRLVDVLFDFEFFLFVLSA